MHKMWKADKTCPRLGRRPVAGYESLTSQIVGVWEGLKAVPIGAVPKPGSPPWVEERCLRLGSLFSKPLLRQHVYFCCKGVLQVRFQSSTNISCVQHRGSKSQSISGEKVKEEAKLVREYVAEEAP